MRRLSWSLQFVLCLFAIGMAGPVSGANYVEVLDFGTVDWTNGFVEAVGVGVPPSNPLNAAHSRAVAERNADLAARDNLVEVVKQIRIDSESQVADHIDRQKVSENGLKALLRKARGVDLSYGEHVNATVSMKLSGALADFILPKSILTISTVTQPQEAERKEQFFTGLIVDCRGVPLQPAMVPLIVDEEGVVVYGPAFASREFATQRGMVSYVRDISSAKAHPRVAPRPLGVKAIRTPQGRPCDIMISQADAARIRGFATNLDFLHQCNVLVVVD